MLPWSLLNMPNPELMADIGEPPAAPCIIPEQEPSDQDAGGAVDGEAAGNGAAAGDVRPDEIPPNHVLPAAYLMWKDLAKYMKERASAWEEQEFRYRKERAEILREIQREQIQKALLESALEEFHRQEELMELERMLRRHELRGG